MPCYQMCLKLRRLPWYCRLSIVILSFVVLEVPVSYLIHLGMNRNVASILFLSGVLAALLFQCRKAFAIQCVLLFTHVAIIFYVRGPNYPSVPVIISATFANFFIIWTIGCLRRGWENAEQDVEKQKHFLALKDQFISNVNHELRSPLTGAIGSLDLLKDSHGQLDEREREMFLDHAIYGCDELQRIADNILDAVRADSDVSPPWVREFNLSRVVTDVLRHIDAAEHPICIDIPDEAMANGDSQQVGQIVRNLLSNCFKYAPKGTPVTVRVWQDDAYTYVCIRDRGPGIAHDQIPLIFQKFSRLPKDITGSVRGIGLGLYICRRFIENMGGRIWVESTGIEGEGSSFCFTVPCALQTTYKMKVVGKKKRVVR